MTRTACGALQPQGGSHACAIQIGVIEFGEALLNCVALVVSHRHESSVRFPQFDGAAGVLEANPLPLKHCLAEHDFGNSPPNTTLRG